MTREEAIVVLKAFMDNPLFSDVHRATFSIAIHDIKQRHEWGINKLMLVPKTEWEQEPTTKNDLGVDCISRADAIKGLGEQPYVWTDSDYEIQQLTDWKNHKEMLENLPSVTPQEPVLDKIRAEIAEYGSIMVAYAITDDTKTDKGIEKLVSDVLQQAKEEVLDIIGKYKAESEG